LEIQLFLRQLVLLLGDFSERARIFDRDGHLPGKLGKERQIIWVKRALALAERREY
jgi:hypothetical protein